MDLKKLNILPPTLLLAFSALFSRVLGVIRDHLLAKIFGATAGTGIFDLDVYYAAFRIPDMIYNLLVLGVVSSAFIPIFIQYKKDNDKKNAWEFASSMLHLMFIAVSAVAFILYIFAPYLAHVIAGGFSDEQIALTAKLIRILLLSPMIFSITSVVVSLQDSYKSFLLRSLGPLMYNIGIISGILFFSAKYGVIGVTWGVIIGALLQLLLQLPALKMIGFKHIWILGAKRADVRKALKLIIPRVLGLSMSQITLFVNTFIASFLMTGSITIFYLSDNLQAVPLGMIGLAYAITSFATLSELASEPTTKPFADEIKKVMGRILYLIIPATIGILVLRSNIIDAVLVYGKFTQTDALLTAKVLGILAISLFSQSLIPITARGFYAFHNTKTPLISGFIGEFVAISGSLILALWLKLGVIGVAIGYSCGNITNFVIMYALLRKKVKMEILNFASIFKIIVIGTIMGSAVQIAKISIPFEGSPAYKLIILAIYVMIGCAVYFGLSGFLGMEESAIVTKYFKRKKAEPVEFKEGKIENI